MRFEWRLLIGSLIAVFGCHTVTRPVVKPELPLQHSVIRDQLVISSDFPLPTQHRLVEELAAQREAVSRELRLPTSDEPIHVFLFRSSDRFHDFIREHHPEFPERRAFFVETDTRLAVYAHWGDRVAEDLRHEVAHGYLHAVVPHLPLWLDEGLAEYFEVPRGNRGLNLPHVALLAAQLDNGNWRPDLARLESLATAGQMNQLDYAESWAWVHLLLETTVTRRDLFHQHLATLREQGAAPPLSVELRKLHFKPAETLTDYIQSLPTEAIPQSK